MDFKSEFYSLYKTYITRQGSDELRQYLEASTFANDPSSSRFHGNYAGGLIEHSVNVCHRLRQLREAFGLSDVSDETIAIVSLLHDLCKIGKYQVELRNVKTEAGWVQKPFYKFVDTLPFGYHGPASVFIIQRFMKLTDEEIAAIACHMGAYDRPTTDSSLSEVYRKYPLAYALHVADCLASFYDEKTV